MTKCRKKKEIIMKIKQKVVRYSDSNNMYKASYRIKKKKKIWVIFMSKLKYVVTPL